MIYVGVTLEKVVGNFENASVCWNESGQMDKLVWRLKRGSEIPNFIVILFLA